MKQRAIEQRGVAIERALRGDGADATKDESELMQEWFHMVHEKNVLVRYESELMVQLVQLVYHSFGRVSVRVVVCLS